MSTEIWKPVVGYEGLYEASNLGRVRSLDRIDKLGRIRHGKVLKPKTTGCGYLQVTLCDGFTKKQTLVHRIICRLFHGEPADSEMQVDHLNKTKSDNRASNLEWVTCSENLIRVGTRWGKYKPVVRIDPDGSEHFYQGIQFAVDEGFDRNEIYRTSHGIKETINGRRWRLLEGKE